MWEGLMAQCKEERQLLETAKFALVHENQYHHSDFIIVGWLLHHLANKQQITFMSFRQNYAHYTSLSKKLGKSIEGYIKTNQLTYVECFQSHFCASLPLIESTPQTYSSPPSAATKLFSKDLILHPQLFEKSSVVFVDSIGFIEDNVELCFWIYQQSILKGGQLIMGGCLQDSEIGQIFRLLAEIQISLENDVGGHGKLTVKSLEHSRNVLWKNVNCRLEFSQHLSI